MEYVPISRVSLEREAWPSRNGNRLNLNHLLCVCPGVRSLQANPLTWCLATVHAARYATHGGVQACVCVVPWFLPVRVVVGRMVVQVIVLDTEGFGAAGASTESDARLFSLATMLCSLLIYNR